MSNIIDIKKSIIIDELMGDVDFLIMGVVIVLAVPILKNIKECAEIGVKNKD